MDWKVLTEWSSVFYGPLPAAEPAEAFVRADGLWFGTWERS